LAIGGRMLFEKKGGEFFAEHTRHVFSFRKRDELILVAFGKHAFKGLTRAQQPALAKRFPLLVR
jgi:hypothetical protein